MMRSDGTMHGRTFTPGNTNGSMNGFLPTGCPSTPCSRTAGPQGFFMLEDKGKGVCDLAYFGIVPESVGKGLGSWLLRTAVPYGLGSQGSHEAHGANLHARPSPRTCTIPETRISRRYAGRDAPVA